MLVDLVEVLYAQLRAGRKITAPLQELATPATLPQTTERQKLIKPLEAFIRMYRPHAAWEDTVRYLGLAPHRRDARATMISGSQIT